jgi:hypothetical protein
MFAGSSTTARVPGGVRGVALKSNGPHSCSHADIDGETGDGRSWLRVHSACGIKNSHASSGKDGSQVDSVAIKWLFHVLIWRSACSVR